MPTTTKATASKADAPVAKGPGRPTVEKFDACPLCGYEFKAPQAKCQSTKACEKRQEANKEAAKEAKKTAAAEKRAATKAGAVAKAS